eukprot:GGOE01036952.1.p1 GENE.GGOE01036952.1~~GGOE01036952.1.p1  ORF type:complete len:727 (+),score=254.70 GGOE01036952.1:49-2229(+)
MYGSTHNLYTSNFHNFTASRYHYTKEKAPVTPAAKRRKEEWNERTTSARQVPSFYGDAQDKRLFLGRFKMRRVDFPEGVQLSESPFMLNVERFDLGGDRDADAQAHELAARVLGCGPRPWDLLDALQCLHVAQSRGQSLDVRCHHHVAGLLLQMGRYDRMVAWYDEVRRDQKAVSRSLPMLHALLCAACHSDHAARTVATTKALLEVSHNTGRPVLFPSAEAVVTHFLPNDAGKTAVGRGVLAAFQALPQLVLRILLDGKQFPIAVRLVEHLHQFDVELPTETVARLFRALMAEPSASALGFTLFAVLREVERFPFTADLLNAFLKSLPDDAGDGQQLFEVADFMLEKQWPLDTAAGSRLMSVCDRAGNAAVAGQYFPILRQQDALDGAAFAQYILLATRTKSIPLADTLRLYRERQQAFGLSSGDAALYQCMYTACFEQNDILQAVELLEDVGQSGCPISALLVALYDYCCTEAAAERIQELSLTPSAEDEENQTELDRLLARAIFVDAVAFEAFAQLFGRAPGGNREGMVQACLNAWFVDTREFFGQRGEEFSTVFSESTAGRMCRGRSFLLVFDSSAISLLADPKVRGDLELLMNDGQARSQKKSVILVPYQTQVQLLKRAEEPSIQGALAALGEWYRGRGDWLKFLHFSNFLECVLRFSGSVAGTSGDAQSERLGILGWIETFSAFHKAILLVTEDEETKAQAGARRIIGISTSTLLQAVNS